MFQGCNTFSKEKADFIFLRCIKIDLGVGALSNEFREKKSAVDPCSSANQFELYMGGVMNLG